MTIQLTPWIGLILAAGVVSIVGLGYVVIRTIWTGEWFSFGFEEDDD